MASNTTCKACIQALRSQQSRFVPRARQLPSSSIRSNAAIRLQPWSSSSIARAAPAPTSQDRKPQPAASSAPTPAPKAYESNKIGASVAEKFAAAAPDLASTYITYGVTEKLYEACSMHATYKMPQNVDSNQEIPKNEAGEDVGEGQGGWWLDEAKLPPTFSTWSQVTYLHMWLLLTRIRHFEPGTTRDVQQQLINHCFHDMEKRMIMDHRISAGSARQKFLKELFSQWRGCIVSYDEGLMKGDAALAAAVWRNVFKGQEDVDGKSLAQIVAWIRRELGRLDKEGDPAVATGQWTFRNPGDEKAGVLLQSQLMRKNGDA